MQAEAHVGSQNVCYAFGGSLPPAVTVDPDARLVVETQDARGGQLRDRPTGAPFELSPPPRGKGNPLTGPVAVKGAEAGDALVVDVLELACDGVGFIGAHAHLNPLWPGRVPVSLGRTVLVGERSVDLGDGIVVPKAPMIGCLGTAPAEGSSPASKPGRHGGNLDHPIVGVGARVYLPVWVDGGLLSVGDVHAAQGDGELSGLAVEVAARVTLGLGVASQLGIEWPWVETRDRLAVLTSGLEFSDARRAAVDAMMTLIEARLGLAPGDALALISAAGDLRIGQAFGGMELTVRLELPRVRGLRVSD